MTDHIQNGQDERAGDAENSDHDAMHRIPYHVGDAERIQKPEEHTAHDDISDDFFYKFGKEQECHDDHEDAGNAVPAKAECRELFLNLLPNWIY